MPKGERVGKKPASKLDSPETAVAAASTSTTESLSGPTAPSKPAWISKVEGFFAQLDPKQRQEAPGSSEEDYDSSESEGDDDEDEEDGDGKSPGSAVAESEAEAEVRVRALLFSHLATKRVDQEPIKMDMVVTEDAPSSGGPAEMPKDAGLPCKVAVFAENELGMVLNKGRKGEAVVVSTARGSAARLAGVDVGDVVVGVNACRTSDFNQILWLLRHSERPMHLLLVSKPS